MKWTTEKRRINDLVPYEHNPRQITDKQYKDLETSLKKFDLVEIPAINKDNTIIAGHQRLNVLQLLGRGDEEIDVRVPDKQLNEKELQEYNIRSNKNTAEWDWDKMANNFDIGDLLEWGFNEKELRIEKDIEEDEAPKVSDEPAISKLGEVYQLGRHRLMCGDSTKIEDVEKLMNGQKADMVFTDPPYNIDLGKSGLSGKTRHGYETHDDDIDDYDSFLTTALTNAYNFAPNAPFYVMSANRDIPLLQNVFYAIGLRFHQTLIWAKPTGMMGSSDYIQNYEAITYGYSGKHQKVNDRSQLACEMFGKDENIGTVGHPTSRPLELVAKFIKNSSKQDDTVLDLFGGSGSTLIACEQTNRTCYMAEISPAYCDVIRKRYAKFMGKEDKWQKITPVV